MALDLFRNSINSLKHHSMIPFDHAKFISNKLPKAPAGKTVLLGRQPIAKKLMIINSQTNVSLPNFQIDEYVSMKTEKLTKAIDEIIPLKHPVILHESMRYSLIPGIPSAKGLFGTLCIASCEVVGGSESAVMPLAVAIEMHSAMVVIQDDLPCLDNEETRGGKPANHKVFGEAATVLACQSLAFLSIQHIVTNTKNVSPDRLLRAIAEMCSSLGSEGLSAGQFVDLKSEGKDISLSELDFIAEHKTVKYIEAVIVSGALIGGGSEEEIERLRKFAKCLGFAYQACDDILDVIGWPEMQESTGRDALRNKVTYPKLMGLDRAKKYAMELVAEAKQELAYFDPIRAAPLYHMINAFITLEY